MNAINKIRKPVYVKDLFSNPISELLQKDDVVDTKDGLDHINIYSKGRTELGRYLSNFAYSPIQTQDGGFNSIEGYWYWLDTHNDNLRVLYGFKAKSFGEKLGKTITIDEESFQNKIKNACWIKIHSNDYYLNMFAHSSLPFKHYYVFNGFIKDAGGKWMLEMWETYRTYIKNGYK
ncbi:MAG: hypothetical protein HQK72_17715 [Desulfamplus sp.]|nr:hypothetical protein [Desulfamplus sp.]